MTDVEKHIVDGKVAVLISPGFGAGWSTWSADKDDNFLVFDKGLVALAEQHASEDLVEAYLREKRGEDYHMYMGGWEKVKVEWVPIGTKFLVHEYDGSESLWFVEDLILTA